MPGIRRYIGLPEKANMKGIPLGYGCYRPEFFATGETDVVVPGGREQS
jgi:hypothetical protein